MTFPSSGFNGDRQLVLQRMGSVKATRSLPQQLIMMRA